jgi:hypothetical protein
MTRADAILAAIRAALTRHPVESPALRTVVIEVHIKAAGGHPRCVVIRPEYEENLEVGLFQNGVPTPLRQVPIGPRSSVST